MISSTRADLDQYRREASKVIGKIAEDIKDRIQLVEVSMERETQSGDREFAVAVSKRWVEESHWIVMIVAWHYGTISDEPGADGLSVTEWEYRHACKLPGRKIFVFMAGEAGTAQRYRYSPGEDEDLKDWIGRQSDHQQAKLKAFKTVLSTPHTAMFASLGSFLDGLERTLRNALEDLPPNIPPGSRLAELVIGVLPAIRACLRKVTVIANCKSIHDRLHELRQHVIRPLREEALAMWRQEGSLSDARERMILRRVQIMSKQQGGLSEARKSIAPSHQGLRDSVDKVLASPDLWNIDESDCCSRPTREQFTERVEAFADDVQQAFSEADRSMSREEADLREDYQTLRERLNHGRVEAALTPAENQRLDEELEILDSHRLRVKDTLTIHHSWQEAHDKLEEVNGFRDADSFERKLKHYQGPPLKKLLTLVDQEITRVADAPGGAVTDAFAASVDVDALQGTATAVTDPPFVKCLRSLRAALTILQTGTTLHAFDEMRRWFDDAFYIVDQWTLKEVERARERVVNLETWLDGLTGAERKRV
ncbi:MAG TPA: DUF4062 domain-containing protein [Vicinamibacterales bacterium]|nr:DUF4062 domain-containing protein [Vicinamibacterales bacterium]